MSAPDYAQILFRKILLHLRGCPQMFRGHNTEPKPFIWKADPDEIVAAVKRGHQMLESIHSVAG